MTKWITRATVLVAALIAAVGGYFWWAGSKTIHDLVHENLALQRALANVQAEEVVAYLRILPPDPADGIAQPHRRVEIAEPVANGEWPAPRTVVLFGDEIYLEAVVVKFDGELVADGRARALLYWRRAFGDAERPADGAQLSGDSPRAPARYAEAFAEVPAHLRTRFWERLGEYVHANEANRREGIIAVYGSTVSIPPREGVLYEVVFSAQGQLYIRVPGA